MREFIQKCHVCGISKSKFVIKVDYTLYREAQCINCGASLRNNAVALALCRILHLPNLSSPLQKFSVNTHIYEMSSVGNIHKILENSCQNYFYSEFYDNIALGSFNNGIRCEDIRRLTYVSNLFDIVISEYVLEHVNNYKAAFIEIRRVLKDDGYFVFTIPFHESQRTIERDEEYSSYPVFHGDHIRGKIHVYNDFGEDLIDWLNSIGLNTKIIYLNKWYESFEISKIYSKLEFNSFLGCDNLLKYFKYNNMVFISRKN